MEQLKVMNPDLGNGVMISNVFLETEDGIRIDTGITYEDIENMRRQGRERIKWNSQIVHLPTM